MNKFIEALNLKEKLRKELKDKYEINVSKASSDWHAKRRPIACGLTIHTGVGCPYQCIYCYIYSMGFPKKISRYPLNPPELIYSILSNPWFIPTKHGTFLALGSVTEPLHPVVLGYTIELLNLISRYLGNPTQLSTKSVLSQEEVDMLRNVHRSLSVLYTITSIKYSKAIEPYAPDVASRFNSIKFMVESGLHVSIFIRPILPGITDIENRNILTMAHSFGVDKVVYGSLRVNRDIIDSIRGYDLDILYEAIKERIDVKRLSKKQVYVKGYDLKEKVVREALSYGFKVFPSACSANIDSVGGWCNICKYGPCGDEKAMIKTSESEVQEFIEFIGLKGKLKVLEVGNYDIHLKRLSRGGDVDRALEYIKTVSRLRLFVS